MNRSVKLLTDLWKMYKGDMKHLEGGRDGAAAVRQRLREVMKARRNEEKGVNVIPESLEQKTHKQDLVDDLARWEVHTVNIAFHMLEVRTLLVAHVESARGVVDRYVDPEITEVFDWVDNKLRVVEEIEEMMTFPSLEQLEEEVADAEDIPPKERQRGDRETGGGVKPSSGGAEGGVKRAASLRTDKGDAGPIEGGGRMKRVRVGDEWVWGKALGGGVIGVKGGGESAVGEDLPVEEREVIPRSQR